MSQTLPDQADRDMIGGADGGLDRNMLVEAAAGTGKTTCMIARMVALLRTGRAETHNIVAVTFTRKAASELQSRFQAKLEQARNEAHGGERANLDRALGQIEQTFIGTIHSFCARLLRERPVEAGVDVGFTELDEYSDIEIRHEAWDAFVHDLLASDDPLPGELNELGLELDRLRDMFISFAEYPDVEHWPADEIVLSPEELAHAAEKLHELDARIAALGEDIDDIARDEKKLAKVYAAVHRRLRYLDTAKRRDLMSILEVCKSNRGVTQKYWPGGKPTAEAEKAWYQNFSETVVEPLMHKWRAMRYAAVLTTVQRATVLFSELRAQRGVLTFQDLLMKATGLLRDNEAVRRVFAERFRYLLVDEFQDTDPIQAEMMMLLTADDPTELNWMKCAPRPGALFVVGDPKQSIYRFRRADIVTYNNVRSRIEDTGGSVVSLTTNFRALPALVEWTNEVFDDLFPDTVSAYSPPYVAMSPGRVAAPESETDLSGIYRFCIPDGNKEQATESEAEQVASLIATWIHDGHTIVDRETNERRAVLPGDFLLLGRRKAKFDEYARSLQAQGIACETAGGEAIRKATEVATLRSALAAAMRADDSASLVAALRGPLYGISDDALYAYKRDGGRFNIFTKHRESLEKHPDIDAALTQLRRIAGWIHSMPPAAALLRTLTELRLGVLAGSYPDGNERTGTMIRAIELIRSIATRTATGRAATMPDLLAALDHLLDSRQIADGMPAVPHEGDAVRIMSVHVAKGLEAPIVFLLDPTSFEMPVTLHVDRASEDPRGYFAIHGAKSSPFSTTAPLFVCPLGWTEHEIEEAKFEREEETRLLYVAATRAISCLIVAQQEKDAKQKRSFWHPFDPYLKIGLELSMPALQESRNSTNEDEDEVVGEIAHDVPRQAERATLSARTRIAQPSYRIVATKEDAVAYVRGTRVKADAELEIYDDDLPRGAAWGELVHLLLEAAMNSGDKTDLTGLAHASLLDANLDPTLAPRVIEIVDRVRDSEVWARAQAASRALVEVPYQRRIADPHGMPTLARGVIDLAFRDLYGWTLVDYKTDRVTPDNIQPWIDKYTPQVLQYAEAFSELSGEPVVEAGLYFVRLNTYVAHDLTKS